MKTTKKVRSDKRKTEEYLEVENRFSKLANEDDDIEKQKEEEESRVKIAPIIIREKTKWMKGRLRE